MDAAGCVGSVSRGGNDISMILLDSALGLLRTGQSQLFVKTSASLAFPSFSPDGHWVAYADTEGGPYEIYVRGFPDSAKKVPITTAGGWLPAWSRSGRELSTGPRTNESWRRLTRSGAAY